MEKDSKLKVEGNVEFKSSTLNLTSSSSFNVNGTATIQDTSIKSGKNTTIKVDKDTKLQGSSLSMDDDCQATFGSNVTFTDSKLKNGKNNTLLISSNFNITNSNVDLEEKSKVKISGSANFGNSTFKAKDNSEIEIEKSSKCDKTPMSFFVNNSMVIKEDSKNDGCEITMEKDSKFKVEKDFEMKSSTLNLTSSSSINVNGTATIQDSPIKSGKNCTIKVDKEVKLTGSSLSMDDDSQATFGSNVTFVDSKFKNGKNNTLSVGNNFNMTNTSFDLEEKSKIQISGSAAFGNSTFKAKDHSEVEIAKSSKCDKTPMSFFVNNSMVIKEDSKNDGCTISMESESKFKVQGNLEFKSSALNMTTSSSINVNGTATIDDTSIKSGKNNTIKIEKETKMTGSSLTVDDDSKVTFSSNVTLNDSKLKNGKNNSLSFESNFNITNSQLQLEEKSKVNIEGSALFGNSSVSLKDDGKIEVKKSSKCDKTPMSFLKNNSMTIKEDSKFDGCDISMGEQGTLELINADFKKSSISTNSSSQILLNGTASFTDTPVTSSKNTTMKIEKETKFVNSSVSFDDNSVLSIKSNVSFTDSKLNHGKNNSLEFGQSFDIKNTELKLDDKGSLKVNGTASFSNSTMNLKENGEITISKSSKCDKTPMSFLKNNSLTIKDESKFDGCDIKFEDEGKLKFESKSDFSQTTLFLNTSSSLEINGSASFTSSPIQIGRNNSIKIDKETNVFNSTISIKGDSFIQTTNTTFTNSEVKSGANTNFKFDNILQSVNSKFILEQMTTFKVQNGSMETQNSTFSFGNTSLITVDKNANFSSSNVTLGDSGTLLVNQNCTFSQSQLNLDSSPNITISGSTSFADAKFDIPQKGNLNVGGKAQFKNSTMKLFENSKLKINEEMELSETNFNTTSSVDIQIGRSANITKSNIGLNKGSSLIIKGDSTIDSSDITIETNSTFEIQANETAPRTNCFAPLKNTNVISTTIQLKDIGGFKMNNDASFKNSVLKFSKSNTKISGSVSLIDTKITMDSNSFFDISYAATLNNSPASLNENSSMNIGCFVQMDNSKLAIDVNGNITVNLWAKVINTPISISQSTYILINDYLSLDGSPVVSSDSNIIVQKSANFTNSSLNFTKTQLDVKTTFDMKNSLFNMTEKSKLNVLNTANFTNSNLALSNDSTLVFSSSSEFYQTPISITTSSISIISKTILRDSKLDLQKSQFLVKGSALTEAIDNTIDIQNSPITLRRGSSLEFNSISSIQSSNISLYDQSTMDFKLTTNLNTNPIYSENSTISFYSPMSFNQAFISLNSTSIFILLSSSTFNSPNFFVQNSTVVFNGPSNLFKTNCFGNGIWKINGNQLWDNTDFTVSTIDMNLELIGALTFKSGIYFIKSDLNVALNSALNILDNSRASFTGITKINTNLIGTGLLNAKSIQLFNGLMVNTQLNASQIILSSGKYTLEPIIDGVALESKDISLEKDVSIEWNTGKIQNSNLLMKTSSNSLFINSKNFQEILSSELLNNGGNIHYLSSIPFGFKSSRIINNGNFYHYGKGVMNNNGNSRIDTNGFYHIKSEVNNDITLSVPIHNYGKSIIEGKGFTRIIDKNIINAYPFSQLTFNSSVIGNYDIDINGGDLNLGGSIKMPNFFVRTSTGIIKVLDKIDLIGNSFFSFNSTMILRVNELNSYDHFNITGNIHLFSLFYVKVLYTYKPEVQDQIAMVKINQKLNQDILQNNAVVINSTILNPVVSVFGAPYRGGKMNPDGSIEIIYNIGDFTNNGYSCHYLNGKILEVNFYNEQETVVLTLTTPISNGWLGYGFADNSTNFLNHGYFIASSQNEVYQLKHNRTLSSFEKIIDIGSTQSKPIFKVGDKVYQSLTLFISNYYLRNQSFFYYAENPSQALINNGVLTAHTYTEKYDLKVLEIQSNNIECTNFLQPYRAEEKSVAGFVVMLIIYFVVFLLLLFFSWLPVIKARGITVYLSIFFLFSQLLIEMRNYFYPTVYQGSLCVYWSYGYFPLQFASFFMIFIYTIRYYSYLYFRYNQNVIYNEIRDKNDVSKFQKIKTIIFKISESSFISMLIIIFGYLLMSFIFTMVMAKDNFVCKFTTLQNLKHVKNSFLIIIYIATIVFIIFDAIINYQLILKCHYHYDPFFFRIQIFIYLPLMLFSLISESWILGNTLKYIDLVVNIDRVMALGTVNTILILIVDLLIPLIIAFINWIRYLFYPKTTLSDLEKVVSNENLLKEFEIICKKESNIAWLLFYLDLKEFKKNQQAIDYNLYLNGLTSIMQIHLPFGKGANIRKMIKDNQMDDQAFNESQELVLKKLSYVLSEYLYKKGSNTQKSASDELQDLGI